MPSVADFLVDFSKEEEGGGGGVRVPDAWHHVKVLGAKPTVSAEKGTSGLEVIFVFQDGKLRKQKKKITDTLWLSPKALSRFRLLLQACGKKVPAKINASKIAAAIKSEELYIQTETEEREGYDPRSRVSFRGFRSVDEHEELAEDEDVEEDEDLEDEDEDEDLEDEDEDEDIEDDEEEEEEPAPKRRRAKKAPAKKAPARKRRPKDEDEEEEDEEEDDEDDEDEEEEEKPRRSRSKAKASTAKKSSSRRKKKAADDDEDEDLSELDLDDL